MAIALDPKQVVSSEQLITSLLVSQDAVIRLLVEKGIFTQEEFLEMVRVVDREMKRKKNLLIQNHISLEVTNER